MNSLSILSKELCQNTYPVQGVGRNPLEREQEGFSEEVTFKWGSGVRQILNSSEGEKGTQTKMTGRAKAPESRSSGEAGSQRPSRVAGS